MADFVGESLTAQELETAVSVTSIDRMRESMKPLDAMFREAFRGGVEAFVYKGTNGRWRGLLGDEEIALYEKARERVMTPDCAHWLEHGSLE